MSPPLRVQIPQVWSTWQQWNRNIGKLDVSKQQLASMEQEDEPIQEFGSSVLGAKSAVCANDFKERRCRKGIFQSQNIFFCPICPTFSLKCLIFQNYSASKGKMFPVRIVKNRGRQRTRPKTCEFLLEGLSVVYRSTDFKRIVVLQCRRNGYPTGSLLHTKKQLRSCASGKVSRPSSFIPIL